MTSQIYLILSSRVVFENTGKEQESLTRVVGVIVSLAVDKNGSGLVSKAHLVA